MKKLVDYTKCKKNLQVRKAMNSTIGAYCQTSVFYMLAVPASVLPSRDKKWVLYS